jgi:GNAT superfamily N-acetyltransferase
MAYTFAMASASRAEELSALVQLSFNQLAAATWKPHARSRFMEECCPARLAPAIASSTFAATAYDGATAVGFILLPRPDLVYLLFVHPQYLRRGIARALWERARAHLEARHPQARTVELNATPVSLAAYRALGFFPISAQLDREGAPSTRMACWLPARNFPSHTEPAAPRGLM